MNYYSIFDSGREEASQAASPVCRVFPTVLNPFTSMKNEMNWSERDIFTHNAFFLWEHRERILSDSRMAQCRLHIGNNLAFVHIQGIASNTLGGYLTWWQEFDRSRRTDSHQRRSLICYIAGSPLSGRNHCAEVYETGKTKTITVAPFSDYWKSFAEAHERALTADDEPQPYTLSQVVEILKSENKESTVQTCKTDFFHSLCRKLREKFGQKNVEK